VVSRGWSPRLDFAGTFDQQWLDKQWPFLPLDFDARHNQSAPADQQSRTLKGGERASLINLTPEGMWEFRLPRLDVPVNLFYDHRKSSAELRLDTILIEPDLRRVVMTSRIAIRTVRGTGILREIVIGHMSRAWLRARSTAKRYLDYTGSGGVVAHERNYSL